MARGKITKDERWRAIVQRSKPPEFICVFAHHVAQATEHPRALTRIATPPGDERRRGSGHGFVRLIGTG